MLREILLIDNVIIKPGHNLEVRLFRELKQLRFLNRDLSRFLTLPVDEQLVDDQLVVALVEGYRVVATEEEEPRQVKGRVHSLLQGLGEYHRGLEKVQRSFAFI